jgi:hypothetical protein
VYHFAVVPKSFAGSFKFPTISFHFFNSDVFSYGSDVFQSIFGGFRGFRAFGALLECFDISDQYFVLVVLFAPDYDVEIATFGNLGCSYAVVVFWAPFQAFFFEIVAGRTFLVLYILPDTALVHELSWGFSLFFLRWFFFLFFLVTFLFFSFVGHFSSFF